MNHSKNQTVFLTVAGYIFKLVFDYEIPSMSHYDNLHVKLIDTYPEFIAKENGSSKIDFTFFIKQEPNFYLMKKQKKFIFCLLSKSQNKSTVSTFSYVSFIQLLTLIRMALSQLIARDKGFLLHASSIRIGDSSCIFTGDSGSGKSTIMKMLSSDYKPFSDDIVAIRKQEGGYKCYQLPYLTKEQVSKTPQGMAIKGIYFLHKDTVIKLEQISQTKKIIRPLLPQLWAEKDTYLKFSQNALRFASHFGNFYNLYFPKDKKIVVNFFRNSIQKAQKEVFLQG